jgi:NADPH-dependent 2,4-dienoyl-CoA reductase/sulfur reductase-like enzyme
VWPKKVERYDHGKRMLFFEDGTSLKADLIFVAIGDIPHLDFVPEKIVSRDGWIRVNQFYQTEDPKIYAIGDITGQGLITHAIGHGREVAQYMHSFLLEVPEDQRKEVIPYERIKKEYYAPTQNGKKKGLLGEAERCFSCGTCRDCHVCEVTCYYGAIKRVDKGDGQFEYVVDGEKCIACGFCAGVCPCGIWEMVTQ